MPAIRNEDLSSLRYYFCHGEIPRGISLVDRICASARVESGVQILSFLGDRLLEQGNLTAANGAYKEAHQKAREAGTFGRTDLLELLCDGLQLQDAAFASHLVFDKRRERAALLTALREAEGQYTGDSPFNLLTKIVISASEIGATKEIADALERFVIGLRGSIAYQGALTGFEHMLQGSACLHECVSAGGHLHELAHDSFYRAYSQFSAEPHYAPLKSYARLGSVKVFEKQRDPVGVSLLLNEAAAELLKVPNEQRPVVLSALVLHEIAKHAVLSLPLQDLYHRTFRELDLPLNYLASALILWNEPRSVVRQQSEMSTDEGREEVLYRSERDLKRAAFLIEGLEGLASSDLARLHMARAFMAERRGDYSGQLEHYSQAFSVAMEETSVVAFVWEAISRVAWNPPEELAALDLVTLFSGLLRINPRHGGDRMTAELRGEFTVGLIRALSALEESSDWKAGVLRESLANLLSSSYDYRRGLELGLSATAEILGGGVELITGDLNKATAMEIASSLGSVYDLTEMSRLTRIPAQQSRNTLSTWLQLEVSALKVFALLRSGDRVFGMEQRIAGLQEEIEARDSVAPEEWRDQSDNDD
jgi:hypothetical protein